MNYDRLPLIKGLLDYVEEENTKFHMPGHRNEDQIEELALLQKYLYGFDVTEVEGTDNLHYPEEMIASSQMLLTEAMGSKESLYCVNGSTSSNYAMIYGLLKREDTVLVQRNCHQSVYNAISLLDLKPVYLMPEIVKEFNLPSSITLEELKRLHKEHRQARAVILTSPTYHGMITDIAPLGNYCSKHGLYLLVDEAHGAHFSFSEMLPDASIRCGAHASSVSFHKTLPSLTQGSVLNLSEKLTEDEILRIRHYHRVFQSSSPSYPLLASMEMARYYMEENGEAVYRTLLVRISRLKEKLKKISGVQVLGKEHVPLFDETRLVLRTPLPGAELDRILRNEYRIQCEMTEGNNLIFILTPFDTEEDLEAIATALQMISRQQEKRWLEEKNQDETTHPMYLHSPERVYSESDALYMESEQINLYEAVGRVSMEKVIPYPPGIPLLLPGELITKEIIDSLRIYMDQNANILKSRSQRKNQLCVVQEK